MALTKKQDFDMDGVVFTCDPRTKWVTVKIGAKKGRVKKNDLWMMVFMISKEKQQDDMIPEEDIEMMQFVRQHQVKATKDIKAGEMITVNCNVNVPMTVVESLLKKEGIENPQTVITKTSELSTPLTAVVPEKTA